MALNAVTIWQVDPKGQWVSTFGVADIAVQETLLFSHYFLDPGQRLARAGVRSHGDKPVWADCVLHDEHLPRFDKAKQP